MATTLPAPAPSATGAPVVPSEAPAAATAALPAPPGSACRTPTPRWSPR